MVTDSLGRDLREARKRSGMPFHKFARLAGFSESHLRSAENGQRAVTRQIAGAYDRVLATGGIFQEAFDKACNHSTDESLAAASLPWDESGTLSAISDALNRSEVDRREFVAVSGAALAGLAGDWQSALSAPAPLAEAARSRQVSEDIIGHIDLRLGHLRRMDDELGSGQLAQLARSELALIARLLHTGRCPEAATRRLYSLASEASRQAAWNYFDQRQHAAARHYFETALRASATGGDRQAGAYALSFLAVHCYSTGQARQAVSLLQTAQAELAGARTPRMVAMLAARAARAYSKTGDRRACAHMLHEAREALDRGPRPDDPPTLYWVTNGEIEMIAGSSALELGDPEEAIRRFCAAISADYRGDDQFPRSHAIYLARAADAYLALHDLDAAVDQAAHAVRCLHGVDSARSASTLAELRAKLAVHVKSPVVRDFLESTS
jgi:tetratricopeptide (TPR) repeat protein